jgi:pyruvate/2-oxoglutarate/acetoin dehydrogenase E1 component
VGIDVEVIDARTLLPFDSDGVIAKSVARTGGLLVVDEDLPGGASAYILQQVLETHGAIDHLDVPARSLSAAASRTPVGTDADHFTKPGREDIFAAAYGVARERDPKRFPALFGDEP